MRLLVLYSELSGYFYSCLINLVENYDVDVQLVMSPINHQAPFNFEKHSKIKLYFKSEFEDFNSLYKHFAKFNPELVFVSGWSDKLYLRMCYKFNNQGKMVIVGFDNQWFGSLKQRCFTLISRLFVNLVFSHAWVPGLYQYEYARRLGFKRDNVLLGLYSGNQRVFNDSYLKNKEKRALSFPKTFVFVGRFSPEKGALELYNTFNSLSENERNGWKLIFIGAGPLLANLISNDNVLVRGFMQLDELIEAVPGLGCLVFPSLRDAWGVSVHELSAAGLPLIVSNAAGSITSFVKIAYNGYTFEAENYQDLKEKMILITRMSDCELSIFGDRSAILSSQITPQIWAANLMSIK
jgi:glycosyltransferase involved in cell wall biosynthesis